MRSPRKDFSRKIRPNDAPAVTNWAAPLHLSVQSAIERQKTIKTCDQLSRAARLWPAALKSEWLRSIKEQSMSVEQCAITTRYLHTLVLNLIITIKVNARHPIMAIQHGMFRGPCTAIRVWPEKAHIFIKRHSLADKSDLADKHKTSRAKSDYEHKQTSTKNGAVK